MPGSPNARGRLPRWLAVVVVAVVSAGAALLLGVVPFQGWLEQRDRNAALRVEVEAVEAGNRAYEDRMDALDTDEEIERLAREEYGLVRPDEEAYAIQPAPASDAEVPGIWPFAD